MTRLTYLRLNHAIRHIAILIVVLGIGVGLTCSDPWELGNMWWSEDPTARVAVTLILGGALVELLTRLYKNPKDLNFTRRLGGVLEEVARSDRSRSMKIVSTPIALMGYGLRTIGLFVGILVVLVEFFATVLEFFEWVA